MPALPSVSQVLKAVVNWTCANIPCVNVFHIRYGGQFPSSVIVSQIAQQVHSAWSQSFIVRLTPIVELLETQVADLTSPTAGVGSYTLHIPGSNSGSWTMNNVAIVGSWSIANRYRGGKPRTYMTGMPTSDMQDALHFNSTATTNWQNAFQGFMNGINGMASISGTGPFQLGCVHYRLNLQPLVTPTFDPFLAVNVLSNIRSQRGRLS